MSGQNGNEAIRGMLTLDELREKVESDEVETIVTVFPDLYGRLMGKRIVGEYFLEQVANGGMHACDYLSTVDKETDTSPGDQYAN